MRDVSLLARRAVWAAPKSMYHAVMTWVIYSFPVVSHPPLTPLFVSLSVTLSMMFFHDAMYISHSETLSVTPSVTLSESLSVSFFHITIIHKTFHVIFHVASPLPQPLESAEWRRCCHRRRASPSSTPLVLAAAESGYQRRRRQRTYSARRQPPRSRRTTAAGVWRRALYVRWSNAIRSC